MLSIQVSHLYIMNIAYTVYTVRLERYGVSNIMAKQVQVKWVHEIQCIPGSGYWV